MTIDVALAARVVPGCVGPRVSLGCSTALLVLVVNYFHLAGCNQPGTFRYDFIVKKLGIEITRLPFCMVVCCLHCLNPV